MKQDVFVVGSLFGSFELLKAVEQRIVEYRNITKKPTTVVFLGNYLMYGNQGWQILKYLINANHTEFSNNKIKVVVLKGLFEDMFEEYLSSNGKDGRALQRILEYGGSPSLDELNVKHSNHSISVDVQFNDALKIIESLPISYLDKDKTLFIGAGFDPRLKAKSLIQPKYIQILHEVFELAKMSQAQHVAVNKKAKRVVVDPVNSINKRLHQRANKLDVLHISTDETIADNTGNSIVNFVRFDQPNLTFHTNQEQDN